MEIQQLRYFISVVNCKNFTRAAKECNVAQPSLSQQIKKLEDELKAPLFHRQGRNIFLTEAAHALLPRAQSILSLHDNAIGEFNDMAGASGIIRFGVIQTMAPYVIPHLLALHKKAVLPAFEAHEDFTENLIKLLNEGTLDFAIMSSPIPEESLMGKVVAQEPFVAVIPSRHKLAKRTKITLEEIEGEDFLPLSRIHCAGQQINDLCHLNTLKVRTAFQSSQIETILRIVSQGNGITVLPQMALSGPKRAGITRVALNHPEIQRDITLVHHPDRYLSKATHTLIEHLCDTINNLLHV